MDTSRSLVLITVDCLRADHTGFMGYPRPTTPFLDALATDSLRFRNAIAAGVPTYYSFPAIMTSRFPLALGRDVVGIAPGEPTLAAALHDEGYATAAFLAGNPYLSKRFGYHHGFDTFVDSLDAELEPSPEDPEGGLAASRAKTSSNLAIRRIFHKFTPTRRLYDELYFRYCQRVALRQPTTFDALRRFPSADAIVDEACNWLTGHLGKPFFLWLHFMDPHAPYYPSPQALQLLSCPPMDAARARFLNSYWNRRDLAAPRLERYRPEIVNLYDAGIRWVDAQLERLVGKLRQLGLWDQCAMALTADHGEEFLDHGERFHSPAKVYEELCHVPLLLRIPGHSSGPVESPFSLVDLAPTLLDVVDVPAPGAFRGSSRWQQLKRKEGSEEPAFTECVATCTNPFHPGSRLGPRVLSVREERYKLVAEFGLPGISLFDLENDPHELHPLPAGRENQVLQRLLDRARCHLANSSQSRDDDTRLAARLRDLRLEWAMPASSV